ncbi:MAG: 4a-hydroxytetrahydrobiopterin dehydratase [Myxococcota bacterium]
MSKACSTQEIQKALEQLPGWEFEADALHKTWTFGDFRQSIAFLVRVAFEAEQAGHHPEIFNVYQRVKLTLRTHDVGNRVTQKDIDLANAIEQL